MFQIGQKIGGGKGGVSCRTNKGNWNLSHCIIVFKILQMLEKTTYHSEGNQAGGYIVLPCLLEPEASLR